jgi:hypothetical protein
MKAKHYVSAANEILFGLVSEEVFDRMEPVIQAYAEYPDTRPAMQARLGRIFMESEGLEPSDLIALAHRCAKHVEDDGDHYAFSYMKLAQQGVLFEQKDAGRKVGRFVMAALSARAKTLNPDFGLRR